MKKLIFISICLLSLTACEKEQNDLIENSFEGASFENWDSFHSHHLNLEEQEDEYAVLNAISGKNYSSFLETAMVTEDEKHLEVADQLTYGLMGILNNDLEFMVGGNIIRYKEGAFYEFNKQTSTSKKVENLEVSIVEFDSFGEKANNSSKIYISGNNTGGYSHRDFWRNAYRRCSDNVKILGPSSRQMRYTQQLKSLRSGSTAFLFIETKLYWRNSKNKLRYAETEERNYTYNIGGSVSIGVLTSSGWRTQFFPINFQRTVNCTKSRWNRQQVASAFPTDGRAWAIDLTGTITHHINGDLNSNKWNASVYWR